MHAPANLLASAKQTHHAVNPHLPTRSYVYRGEPQTTFRFSLLDFTPSTADGATICFSLEGACDTLDKLFYGSDDVNFAPVAVASYPEAPATDRCCPVRSVPYTDEPATEGEGGGRHRLSSRRLLGGLFGGSMV